MLIINDILIILRYIKKINNMECQKVKNLLTAKEEGKYFLQKYIESKDRLYLQKAMDIDNTNSDILLFK